MRRLLCTLLSPRYVSQTHKVSEAHTQVLSAYLDAAISIYKTTPIDLND